MTVAVVATQMPVGLFPMLASRFPAQAAAAVMVVNSANDVDDGTCDGVHCSLREAITAANGQTGIDSIVFAIPGPAAPVIAPTQPLPTITEGVTIDGTTQGTWVVLDGTAAGAETTGLFITNGNTSVRGLVVQRFANVGIWLEGSGQNSISGNRIGTTLDGFGLAPNGGSGVVISGSLSNTIGGLTPADRNLISGNNVTGITIMSDATGNTVRGNYIGLGADGRADVRNAFGGIQISTAGNTVRNNVISGNNLVSPNSNGIHITGVAATGNVVAGNLIGPAADGTRGFPNAENGIVIADGASNNTIGGSTPADRNVISGNSKNGVHIASATSTGNVIEGNYIGLEQDGQTLLGNGLAGVFLRPASGTTLAGNTIRGNVIAANQYGVSIELGAGPHVIQSNLIGLAADGLTSRPNTTTGLYVYLGETPQPAAMDISGNTVSGNAVHGMYLYGVGGATVANNRMGLAVDGTTPRGNGSDGLVLINSSGVNIDDNVLANNAAGVVTTGSLSNTFRRNSVLNNGTVGLMFNGESTLANAVQRGSISNNDGKGILLASGAHDGIQPPTITDVTIGATLTVSGQAALNAFVQVYADPMDEGLTFLGETTASDGDGSWSISTWVYTDMSAIATAVKAGTLKLHATQTTAQGTSEFSTDIVTATAITGIATCNGETRLLGATVELYSGSVLVATTTSSLDTGVYVFPGVAPNSIYTIRISKHFVSEIDPYTISCAVTVTTDARGNATAPPGTSILNRRNHTWPAAFTLTPGVAITDYIFREGQSTWFKVPIRPGQRVSVKITNVPANYSLALYKDIRKLYDQQKAALEGTDPLGAIGNIDASVSPDALSPDELSPDELSPDELSPDALSPDELSPDELSPDELSPDELSPDELSPDALSPDELSPDELSPDELSPDELSPDAYAGAQTAALIGVSAHVGLSPEQIARNTWDNTGFFYMRVRGHNGAFDASLPFTIQPTITDVSCAGATLAEYPVTLTATSNKQTVILTNTARLGGDTATFMTNLNTFAARAEVQGAVVDLATLPAVQSAYEQWDTPAGQACPAAANIVAHSVKGVITAYRALNPGLKYVVIAGNDDVVPFFRQPDQSGLGSEKDYRPAVQEPTASQASLRLGYVLTDDFYGSTRPISRFDHELYLPDLAVGRLTETIGEMTTVIDAYISTNGVVAPTRALVTGYDFLSDAADFIADQLAANTLTVDRQLIQPVGDSPSDSTAWTAAQLSAKLFGATSYGILSLNGHFSANTMLAADYATRLESISVSGLPPADTRFRNALVLSTGCHSGYNIVDSDATALTDPVDWAQAFGSRGATFIGGTGYQYGDTDFMKYTEKIHADLTLELRYGTGPVAIGVALANAKRTYISTLVTLKGIDEKALAEATLFGLPMLSYNLPAGSRLPLPPTGTVSGLTTATSFGLSYAPIAPIYTLNRNARTLDVIGGGTETAIYYDIDGNVAVSPEAPVLPQLTIGVGATGQAVRGAVLMNATYADEQGITPFTDVATTEVRGAHPRYVTEVFTPVRPFDLNHFAGSNLISTPFQFRSTDGGTTGVARRFTSEPGSPMSFRLYYSNLTDPRALAAAPVVYNVTLTPNGANVDVLATVGALTTVGIEQVFVTFTAETGSLYGQWTSLALTRTSATSNGPGSAFTYAGSIPRGGSPELDVRAIIQAVGGNGLVTWSSNDGAYYQVVYETATAADPKDSTSLTLDVPATGTYLSTVEVSARLMTGGAALANQPVSFRSGGARVEATTDSAGYAKAPLMLDSAPGAATVSVGFAEDLDFLGSGAETTITVLRAPSSFTALDTAPLPVGGSVLLATLIGAGEPLGGQLVTLTGGGFTEQTLTDGYGRVRLDTDDGFPSGAYSVTITYDGNDRYLPAAGAAAATVLIVVYDPSAFVTAGGWILTVPGGGLVPDKKTNFGVHMKYKSGTTTAPTGSVEFKAKESDVTFRATSLDWLAINGSTAEAQGRGTVNGVAGYTFRVVLVDGSPDRFEIRIWRDGTDLNLTPTYQAGGNLGGGNVQVH